MILLIVLLCVYNVDAILNLTEGSECFIHGHKGKCVGAKSCESFNLVDLEERNLRLTEICSHNNIEVVVCCLDCKPFKRDYRDSAILGDGYIWKNGRKSWDKCVEFLGKHEFNCIKYRKRQNVKIYDKEKKCFTTDMWITGASYAYSIFNRVNSAAHVAFLEYGNKTFSGDTKFDVTENNDTSSVTQPDVTEADVSSSDVTMLTGTEFCAGSIISERFILTAAQCSQNAENEPVTYVVLNLSGDEEDAKDRRWYEVKRFIQHPDYKPTVPFYHDIALIETKTEIVFTFQMRPICLLDDLSLNENNGVILAWSSENEETGVKNDLIFESVNIFNSAKCSFRFLKQLPQGINATLQSCYQDRDDERSCESVPGLPLELTKPLFSCARFLSAVVTNNRTCGEADSIRLYTRVQPYIPWIEGIVWPDV